MYVKGLTTCNFPLHPLTVFDRIGLGVPTWVGYCISAIDLQTLEPRATGVKALSLPLGVKRCLHNQIHEDLLVNSVAYYSLSCLTIQQWTTNGFVILSFGAVEIWSHSIALSHPLPHTDL